MPYVKQSEFVFDCLQCPTPCDGISKGVYEFNNDVSFSEQYEQMIINRINSTKNFTAVKSAMSGYPDIEIRDLQDNLHRYLEVKVQQRTFMSVEKLLPGSNLKPSETVALNLSDLLRYFKIQRESKINTIIIWVLLKRLCIIGEDEHRLYFQTSHELERIYNLYKGKRLFKRRSGKGDVVDGLHKGVTVNYHFSLAELKPWVW